MYRTTRTLFCPVKGGLVKMESLTSDIFSAEIANRLDIGTLLVFSMVNKNMRGFLKSYLTETYPSGLRYEALYKGYLDHLENGDQNGAFFKMHKKHVNLYVDGILERFGATEKLTENIQQALMIDEIIYDVETIFLPFYPPELASLFLAHSTLNRPYLEVYASIMKKYATELCKTQIKLDVSLDDIQEYIAHNGSAINWDLVAKLLKLVPHMETTPSSQLYTLLRTRALPEEFDVQYLPEAFLALKPEELPNLVQFVETSCQRNNNVYVYGCFFDIAVAGVNPDNQLVFETIVKKYLEDSPFSAILANLSAKTHFEIGIFKFLFPNTEFESRMELENKTSVDLNFLVTAAFIHGLEDAIIFDLLKRENSQSNEGHVRWAVYGKRSFALVKTLINATNRDFDIKTLNIIFHQLDCSEEEAQEMMNLLKPENYGIIRILMRSHDTPWIHRILKYFDRIDKFDIIMIENIFGSISAYLPTASNPNAIAEVLSWVVKKLDKPGDVLDVSGYLGELLELLPTRFGFNELLGNN